MRAKAATMRAKPVTLNLHHYSVPTNATKLHPSLGSFFRVVATNTVDGVSIAQVKLLTASLNGSGLGFYALLLKSCDRRGPLMDYEWRRELGKGSFGLVQLMIHRHTDRNVALKLIKVEDETKIAFASKEMGNHQRAASASEFVVALHTWGQINDEFFFVSMEFCAGGDVDHLLRQTLGAGMTDDALRWKLYYQICQGLAAIHSAGIIHMDVKPPNGELRARPVARGGARARASGRGAAARAAAHRAGA